jgi:hypothetical protein
MRILESLGPVHHGLTLEDCDDYFYYELQDTIQGGMYVVSPERLSYRAGLWSNMQIDRLLTQAQAAMKAKWKENMLSEKEKRTVLKKSFKEQ